VRTPPLFDEDSTKPQLIKEPVPVRGNHVRRQLISKSLGLNDGHMDTHPWDARLCCEMPSKRHPMLAGGYFLWNAYPHVRAGNVSDPEDGRHPDGSLCETRTAVTVNLTRIYTKLGDGGETHLGDMSRVSKLHPRVEAYGTVDELNAALGVALCQPGLPPRFAGWLRRVQNDLLDVGADLSVPSDEEAVEVAAGARRRKPPRPRLRISPAYTEWLEEACDEVNDKLQPLRSFVIPGGNLAAAHLHVCRTVCRRAERRAIAVEDEGISEVVRYLNRLSDLLFILSRAVAEEQESLWEPGAHGADPGAAAAP
jgi:cob(I)alamin adenosyltransferase